MMTRVGVYTNKAYIFSFAPERFQPIAKKCVRMRAYFSKARFCCVVLCAAKQRGDQSGVGTSKSSVSPEPDSKQKSRRSSKRGHEKGSSQDCGAGPMVVDGKGGGGSDGGSAGSSEEGEESEDGAEGRGSDKEGREEDGREGGVLPGPPSGTVPDGSYQGNGTGAHVIEAVTDGGDPADLIADTGRLFVRNLTYSASEADLAELFGEYGDVSEVHVVLDRWVYFEW